MSNESATSDESDNVVSVHEFPDILATISGTLEVGTDDDDVGNTVFSGFGYLLSCEFARQQPALALLYQLELVQVGPPRHGCRTYDFEITLKIRGRVKDAVKKAGVAVAITAITIALGIPASIWAGIQIYDRLIPPVQVLINKDMPHAPSIITINGIRNSRGGGNWNL